MMCPFQDHKELLWQHRNYPERLQKWIDLEAAKLEKHKDLGDKWERYMFSHILSKGSNPAFRHDKDNINILCLECHQVWEFGDKKSMGIYPENEEIIQMLREKILN